ncbi:unnamed protein product [Allacma fusca]|uniref:B-cell lymphoma 9 beta-catenin binding domain-containing protein n=1 Tax=Allacma fusca TaxID=39272 RepID=A0A8J2L318_9HEXA|nr:unnamed protein product [Allacma fusca]
MLEGIRMMIVLRGLGGLVPRHVWNKMVNASRDAEIHLFSSVLKNSGCFERNISTEFRENQKKTLSLEDDSVWELLFQNVFVTDFQFGIIRTKHYWDWKYQPLHGGHIWRNKCADSKVSCGNGLVPVGKSKSPGGGAAKNSRRKNKNGMKIKEEKSLNPGGPDPGGGPGPNLGSNLQDLGDGSSQDPGSNKGLPDDLILNGADIKLENPSTPLLDKSDCSDMPPLSDLGHPDFPDCKPPMNPYCYPHYNNNLPPGGGSMPPHPHGPGDYGPPMMGNYGPSGPPQTKQQPSTLEAQYMQQQSQIFVFSTKLANKAADAVFQGQCPSIIGFHMSQPATRKFLEFQGNPNWPPPAAPTGKGKGAKNQQQQQQQQQMGMPGPPNLPPDSFNMHHGGPPPPPWNAHNSPPQKSNQQGYSNYYESPPFCGGGMGPQQPGPNPGMMGPGPQGPPPPGGPMPSGQLPGYFPGGPNNQPPGNGPQGPMPTGIKIPDENLTPQQLQHREQKLAKMRTMYTLLFPENDHPHTPGDPNCHPMPPHENMNAYDMPGGPPPMGMDYNMPGQGGPNGPNNKGGNDWSSSSSNFFMDGQPVMKPGLPPPNVGPPSGNGPRSNKVGGGSIPSPATPLTPGSSCGGHHRPSPHSPMPSDPVYQGGGGPGGGGGGHSFYPTGYYSPQVGQVQDNSPSAAVQRKDSESSNSEGGKSRKDKSSCSISPTSSAPPSVKEANLMPVPSPQQIQYLNVFEGQELTIQKQPNVGLSDHTNDHSPGLPSNLDMNPSTPNVNQQKPSHSAPPTPGSLASMTTQKSNSEMSLNVNSGGVKTRPGSVGPVATPKNSTTPNPSPQAPDRNSQPGTPLQLNLDGMKNLGNPVGFSGPGMGNNGPAGPQPPCNMLNKGPGAPGNKPAFDPISSMVQMSQQLTGGNGTPPNPPGSGMGGNGGYGMNTPGGPPMNPNMVNFNTSMHSVQNVDGGMAMGGPQTVNNTYVNATMTIQQMNIQNIPPYNMGMGHQMGSHMPQQMGQQMGHMPPAIGGAPPGPPPPNMQQPIMGPGPMCGSGPMGPGMGGNGPMVMGGNGPPMGQMGSLCSGPPMPGRGVGPPPQMMYGNQSPRMGQNVRSAPYRLPPNSNNPRAFGGTNIQVKPNAPNTIQYLPARPPPPHSQGPMCSQSGVMGGPGPGVRSGPNLDFLQRYTNPNPGPVVNVNMGMNVNVNMGGNRMGYPGPPGGMGNPNGPPCGIMRAPHPPPHMSMMDQGPNPGGPVGPGQPLPPAMMPGMKGPGMYPNAPSGPQQQQQGPPPSDPGYAQQFHHFQQQLYATGTNNGRNPMQPNVQNNPNTPPNQTFFKTFDAPPNRKELKNIRRRY